MDARLRSVGNSSGNARSKRACSFKEFWLCETTAPPPSPKQIFSAPKLKIPRSPKLPAKRPSMVAPRACAASSITRTSLPRASSTIAPISAGLPKRCGTIIALVFLVIAASTVLAVRLSSVSQSAKTGNAPTARIGGTIALQQKAGRITSSPAFIEQARKAISSANLPLAQRRASSMRYVSISRERKAPMAGPSTTLRLPME